MIITDDFLLGVTSYEILAVANAKGHYTKFTFRFPQWWKRNKVLKMQWVSAIVGDPNKEDRRIWAEPQAAQDLRTRLIFHFQTRKYAA